MFFSGLLGAIAAQGKAVIQALLWVAPDSIGITNPIQTWIDKTTPQYDPTQAVVANRPALIADIDGNGHAGARFDATDVLNALLVLPLPWTMAIAVKVPSKPGSKSYILGKAGTGGIYITSSGFIGNDLGGVGVEGTTDVTTGHEPIDFDFSTLTLPDTILDTSTTKPVEALVAGGAGGTKYTMESAADGHLSVAYQFNGANDSLASYGTRDFEVGITFSSEDVAAISTEGGVDYYFYVKMSDGKYIRILHRQRGAANEPAPKKGIKVGTDSGQIGVIATGSLDETDAKYKITREGNNLKAYYNGVLEGTYAITPSATISRILININNSPGFVLPSGTKWYCTAKDFYALNDVGQPLKVPTGVSNFLVVQATAESGATSLYIDDVQKASGSIGSGTLPSIDLIEAGLGADVTEARIHGYVRDSEELSQDAAELSIYQ